MRISLYNKTTWKIFIIKIITIEVINNLAMNRSFCSLLSKSVFINLFEWTFLLNGFKLVPSDINCYFYFYKLNVIEIIMIEKEYDYIFKVLLVGNML